MQKFAIIMGILSTLLCLAAGALILTQTGLVPSDDQDDIIYIWQAMGLYFVAKGCFVGPMLILTAATPAKQ